MVNATHATAAAPAIVAENHFFRHELNQEVRVNSDFDSPLNFTAGAFYQDGKMSDNVTILGNTFIRLPALLGNGLSVIDIKTYSMFGQARWKVMDRLELAGGGRWTSETRNATEINLITGAIIPTPVTHIHSSRFSPEATLTYRPTDDMTLFAAYKQETKSGSFSISTPPQANTDNSFGDEKVKGYELGLKSRLLDRTLNLNASWYDYRYYGLQVGAIDPPKNGLPVIHTVNAGEAHTYGIDFDVNYRPPSVQGLTLNGSANWNHARYITLTNVPCWGGQMISEAAPAF
jgi:iron complex outermembrane receptor protein